VITHIDVNKYYRCPTLLYLDKHGPRSERHVHPLITFYQKKKHEKEYMQQDLDNYVAQTFNMFSMGKTKINNAWINANNFYARIERLRKKDGESFFGPYHYVPVFHHFKHTIKKPLLMEIVYKLYVLSQFQERQLTYFIMEDKNSEEEHILDTELFEALQRDLVEIQAIVEKKKVINPSITQKCKICSWVQYCRKVALELKDLSLISGIGNKIKNELREKGIENLKHLASVDIKNIELENVSESDLRYFKLQATSLIENKPIINNIVELPNVDREFFIDIEASAYHNLVWLIGCLIRDRNEVRYIPIVSHTEKDEREMVKKFLDIILEKNGSSFTIYHWSSTEPSYFSKLRHRYPDLKEQIERVLPHFIDLFKVFKRNIILPVFSYTLKEVAKFLGFNWHEPLIDGATSIMLFEKWKKTKKPILIERAIAYNSDDCKALMIIKDYIVKAKKMR